MSDTLPGGGKGLGGGGRVLVLMVVVVVVIVVVRMLMVMRLCQLQQRWLTREKIPFLTSGTYKTKNPQQPDVRFSQKKPAFEKFKTVATAMGFFFFGFFFFFFVVIIFMIKKYK